MTKIFISYRRNDDPYAARGINDALVNHFGEENVYFDLDALQAGLDWREQIDNMVAECDVMLVVIGDEWLQVDASGRSRLENEVDLVREEVSSALKRDIPVIPILVGNATIPGKELLPEELEPLVYRQVAEVRATANFGAQINRLLKSIKAVAPEEISLEVTQAEAVATKADFGKISNGLKHPLVLVGFTFMLVMWLFGKLIDSGVIPELDQTSGSALLKSVIDYSVWIGFVIITSGVLLQLSRARRVSRWVIAIAALILLTVLGMMVFKQWQSYRTDVTGIENDNLKLQLASEKKAHELEKKARELAETRVDMLIANSSSVSVTETDNEKDEQIKALTATIIALQNQEGTDSRIASALKFIDEKGDTRPAEAIFQDILDEKLGEGQQANLEAAEAARHLGSLAFLHDTEKAFAAYRQATELDPNNAEGWSQLGHLLIRVGELDRATQAYQEVEKIGIRTQDRELQAVAYSNLGIVYNTRGNLDLAEAMYRKALAINEDLESKAGMATNYANLGIVYMKRGDLDDAEAMYRKALAINEELGNKESMAINYGNLGIVYDIRGDIDDAEAMHLKSLAINEELGSKAGMATDYGNLGIVYMYRDELDQAEAMLLKSLALDEELGRKEGMANNYGNLGNVYDIRGDIDLAEAMFRKALEVDKELGSKTGMAAGYSNLGQVYEVRGDLDQAEAMYRKALAINEEMGSKAGMATNYSNLGIIYDELGDTTKAIEFWQKAKALFTEIGANDNAQQVDWLISDSQGSGFN